MSVATLKAQTQEGTDSLTRELQEVVVTANQPATRLAGTTLYQLYLEATSPTSAMHSTCLPNCR